MTQITDLPIWTDCPFRSKVPAEYTIHRGKVEGYPSELVAIHFKDQAGNEWHVDASAEAFSPANYTFQTVLAPMLNNLGGARLQAEFSDLDQLGVARRIAEALHAGKQPTETDLAYYTRSKELCRHGV